MSQLQHLALSRIILERFIEKNKFLLNHNQIPLYFVQQLYCEEFLQKQVNWNGKGAHGGVAHEQPIDRKKPKLAGTRVQRMKPIILSPIEHANFEAHATEGVTLATGCTANQVIEESTNYARENKSSDRIIKYFELT